MTTISLKLPDELASQLDAAAKALRKTRSEFCRNALQEKLAASRRRGKPSLYERSKDLCGIGDSRLGDLSTDPRHLDGFGA